MNFFSQLFGNYVLVCAMLGWTLAQVFKAVATSIRDRKINWERLFGAGGMPSGHSATVSALVVSVSRKCGVDSVFFAFSVVLASIVIYDAMGVRRAAGEQAKVINKIVRINNEDEDESNNIDAKVLKEKLGHTPIEVLAGVLLGVLIPLVIPIV